MARQLNIRSDEAYQRAHRLAKWYGTTTSEAVVRSLRRTEAELLNLPTVDELTPEQRATYDRLRALARQARKEATNPDFGDDDLYDESGLPK